MAIVAVHLGVIDEQLIDNMAYIFFEDLLAQLGHRLNYEAVVNYAGNSFCEKSWEMISDSNPFNIQQGGSKQNKSAMNSLANFFASADIKIKKKDKGDSNGKV